MTTALPEPHGITPCRCGHPVCKSYFVDVTRSDGRVDYEEALVLSQSERLLIVAEWARNEILRLRQAIAARGLSRQLNSDPGTHDFENLSLVIEQARGDPGDVPFGT